MTNPFDDIRMRFDHRKLFCQASMLVAESQGKTYHVLLWQTHIEEIELLTKIIDDVEKGIPEPAPNIAQERDALEERGVIQMWKRPRKNKRTP